MPRFLLWSNIMPRNVEIKATVPDIDKLLKLTQNLCSTEAEVLKQHDTFYRVPSGRLKLRSFEVCLC